MEDLGAFLQQAREVRNLSIADIADRTKIRQQYLTAIEQGERESLPDEVYLRGFLRSYAKALGIDPEEVITRYDNRGSEPIKQFERVSLVDKRRAARQRQRIKFLIGVGVIIVALLIYHYYFK